MNQDRLKGAIEAVVQNALPFYEYRRLYYGRIVSYDFRRQQVDVECDDPLMPSMQGVPLRGPAGIQWSIDPGTPTSVLIGWENANPSRPFAIAFSSGAHVLAATWNVDLLTLGGDEGAEPPPKGLTLNAALATFLAALQAYTIAIQGIADPTGTATGAVTAAIGALEAALPAALAVNVMVR